MNSEIPLNHHPKDKVLKIRSSKSKEVINIKVRIVIICRAEQGRVGAGVRELMGRTQGGLLRSDNVLFLDLGGGSFTITLHTFYVLFYMCIIVLNFKQLGKKYKLQKVLKQGKKIDQVCIIKRSLGCRTEH